MAFCFFKCMTSCGCRDCLISKFAFYPPCPGYRFIEILPRQSTNMSQLGKSRENSEKKTSNLKLPLINEITKQPRISQIDSYDNKQYQFILVYEQVQQENKDDQAVRSERQSCQSKDSLQSNVNKESKKKQSTQRNTTFKEEIFEQVDDLNLICFKRKSRGKNVVSGYHIEYLKRRSEVVILYSHGNSTDIGYIVNQILDVSYNLGVNVIAYDYGGYGESTGVPSEKGFIYDLHCMYILARELGYHSGNIILYGQSVGSGPSTFLASQKEFPIGGLIIHSGFSSGLRISKQMSMHVMTHPSDFFPNIEFIKRVNAPVLIIHGTEDQDIKMHHASDLYTQAKKHYEPFFMLIEGAGHNNIEHDQKYRREYFTKLKDFIRYLRRKTENMRREQESLQHAPQDHSLNGYPGDGWRESFDHIYKSYFQPSQDTIEIKIDQAFNPSVLSASTLKQQSPDSSKENLNHVLGSKLQGAQGELEQSEQFFCHESNPSEHPPVYIDDIKDIKQLLPKLTDVKEGEKQLITLKSQGSALGGDSLSVTSQKDINEEDDDDVGNVLRLHRVTSFVQQRQNSYLSAYLIENNHNNGLNSSYKSSSTIFGSFSQSFFKNTHTDMMSHRKGQHKYDSHIQSSFQDPNNSIPPLKYNTHQVGLNEQFRESHSNENSLQREVLFEEYSNKKPEIMASQTDKCVADQRKLTPIDIQLHDENKQKELQKNGRLDENPSGVLDKQLSSVTHLQLAQTSPHESNNSPCPPDSKSLGVSLLAKYPIPNSNDPH